METILVTRACRKESLGRESLPDPKMKIPNAVGIIKAHLDGEEE
jgi:hypothetical protein